jgi:hypothetical protein
LNVVIVFAAANAGANSTGAISVARRGSTKRFKDEQENIFSAAAETNKSLGEVFMPRFAAMVTLSQ